MTWTLRFYDDAGQEIARVQADPYEWEVHSREDTWRWLRVALEGYAEVYSENFDTGIRIEDGIRLKNEPRPLDLPPKVHLQRIEDDLGGKVARTELADE